MDSVSRIVLADFNAADKKVFAEGERVFVRVLGAAGSGRYEVSFGGMRFFADSHSALRAGDSFPALITFQGGKIALAPQDANEPLVPAGLESRLEAAEAARAAIASLGIPVDEVSFAIVRFMQQFGFKFDVESAFRARKLAKRFPSRETKAAEAALYLLKKGIDADERMVGAILEGAFYSGESGEGRGNQSGQSHKRADDSDSPENESLLDFFDAESLDGSRPGLLTLANHIASSERHWILLPFELGANIKGIVKILFNLAQKSMEKAEIRAQSIEKSFHFVVYYSPDPKARQRLNIVFDGDAHDVDGMSRLLAERGVDAAVRSREWRDGGLFTEEEDILTFQAEA